MLSQPDETDLPQTTACPDSTLLDLSRQLRNLLLLRPLFQLEFNKLHIGNEGAPDAGLFQEIDTGYQPVQGTVVAQGSGCFPGAVAPALPPGKCPGKTGSGGREPQQLLELRRMEPDRLALFGARVRGW